MGGSPKYPFLDLRTGHHALYIELTHKRNGASPSNKQHNASLDGDYRHLYSIL